jgi:hypothetical protein
LIILIQSQQSFNTLTPFYFLSHSLHVSAPTGHLQVRYTIKYFENVFFRYCSYCMHRDSAVAVTTSIGLDRSKIFHLSTSFGPVLGPIQPHIQ